MAYERFQKQSQIICLATQNGNIQTLCTPAGQTLFNRMARMAETPPIQNRSCSKVSYNVCTLIMNIIDKADTMVHSRVTTTPIQPYHTILNTKQTGISQTTKQQISSRTT